MSMSLSRLLKTMNGKIDLLRNGDRLTQPEFHRRYLAYPEDIKFELVGGIVYMASPLSLPHSRYDEELGFPFGVYKRATPGVEVLRGATTVLGKQSEPQPDLGLRILPEYGGRTRTVEELVHGSPELLAEIGYSTRAIDMNQKRDDYEKAGVCEYVVVCVEEQELHWFDFARGREIKPNLQGVYQSRVFPGLWIAGTALLARDSAQVEAVVRAGIASRAHAAFVKRLQTAHRRLSR